MDYKRQRNLRTYLLRKAKRDYYSRVDPSKITDNKNFWKAVKPLFCDKNMASVRTTLVGKGEILQDETAVAKKLNDIFSNAVKNLNIKINDDLLNDDPNEVNPVMKAITKYSHHRPSILKIIEFSENKTVNSKRENKFCLSLQLTKLYTMKLLYSIRGRLPLRILFLQKSSKIIVIFLLVNYILISIFLLVHVLIQIILN